MLISKALLLIYFLNDIKCHVGPIVTSKKNKPTHSFFMWIFERVFLRTWWTYRRWGFKINFNDDANWKNVYIRTADDVKIGTWVYETAQPKKCLIMLHGIARNRKDLAQCFDIPTFIDAGYTIVIPDYRQFGDSFGTFKPDDVNLDIDAVHKYCLRFNVEIVLVGYSFGGAIALKYCASVGGGYKNKVILIATFSNILAVLEDRVLYTLLKWMFPSVEKILKSEFYYDGMNDISVLDDNQVLLIHGVVDKMVLPKHSMRLAQVKKFKAQFIESCDHNSILTNHKLFLTINAFLENEPKIKTD